MYLGPNKTTKHLLLLILFAALSACNIELRVPQGGRIYSESLSRHCEVGQICRFEVTDTSFSDGFVAEAEPGFVFTGWKSAHKHLCSGSTKVCRLSTKGFPGNETLMEFLRSDDTFYLEPVFTPIAEVAPRFHEFFLSRDEVCVSNQKEIRCVDAEGSGSQKQPMPSKLAAVNITKVTPGLCAFGLGGSDSDMMCWADQELDVPTGLVGVVDARVGNSVCVLDGYGYRCGRNNLTDTFLLAKYGLHYAQVTLLPTGSAVSCMISGTTVLCPGREQPTTGGLSNLRNPQALIAIPSDKNMRDVLVCVIEGKDVRCGTNPGPRDDRLIHAARNAPFVLANPRQPFLMKLRNQQWICLNTELGARCWNETGELAAGDLQDVLSRRDVDADGKRVCGFDGHNVACATFEDLSDRIYFEFGPGSVGSHRREINSSFMRNRRVIQYEQGCKYSTKHCFKKYTENKRYFSSVERELFSAHFAVDDSAPEAVTTRQRDLHPGRMPSLSHSNPPTNVTSGSFLFRFTAAWSPVPNASKYLVQVHDLENLDVSWISRPTARTRETFEISLPVDTQGQHEFSILGKYGASVTAVDDTGGNPRFSQTSPVVYRNSAIQPVSAAYPAATPCAYQGVSMRCLDLRNSSRETLDTRTIPRLVSGCSVMANVFLEPQLDNTCVAAQVYACQDKVDSLASACALMDEWSDRNYTGQGSYGNTQECPVDCP